MGVPVITLPGYTFAGRHAATHLSNVGLTDWLAQSPEHYIALAIKWSRQLDELAKLRAELRERVANSALCDAAGFARNLEDVLRKIWQRWCQENQSLAQEETNAE